MRKVIIIAASIVALTDARTAPSAEEARSRLLLSRAVATNYSIVLADYHAMAEAAAKKYGPKAKTVMQNGQVTTTVDGKVVATEMVKARVEDVFGIFLVGRRSDEMARFPFALKVSGDPDRDGDRRRNVGQTVRARFAKQAPQLFDFNDLEWANLWCWSDDAPDAGASFADASPRLNKADLCLVRWRRGDGKTMLIGALAADGGDFVRDASRPICRALTARWLAGPERSVQDTTIDYAACLLVHDPDRGNRGARETVVEHIYEVRPDRSLALID